MLNTALEGNRYGLKATMRMPADPEPLRRRLELLWRGIVEHEPRRELTSEGDGSTFGWDVDVHGDLVVVGAPYADTSMADTGTAQLYQRVGTSWSFLQDLAAPLAYSGSLGSSVAIEDDYILACGRGITISGNAQGTCYTFRDEFGSWMAQNLSLIHI